MRAQFAPSTPIAQKARWSPTARPRFHTHSPGFRKIFDWHSLRSRGWRGRQEKTDGRGRRKSSSTKKRGWFPRAVPPAGVLRAVDCPGADPGTNPTDSDPQNAKPSRSSRLTSLVSSSAKAARHTLRRAALFCAPKAPAEPADGYVLLYVSGHGTPQVLQSEQGPSSFCIFPIERWGGEFIKRLRRLT